MKKLWASPVPFLAYGVPYAYLGFWGHGETGKVLANFLSIIGVITLMKWTYHRNQSESPVFGKCPVPAGILRLPVRVRNGEMGRDL